METGRYASVRVVGLKSEGAWHTAVLQLGAATDRRTFFDQGAVAVLCCGRPTAASLERPTGPPEPGETRDAVAGRAAGLVRWDGAGSPAHGHVFSLRFTTEAALPQFSSSTQPVPPPGANLPNLPAEALAALRAAADASGTHALQHTDFYLVPAGNIGSAKRTHDMLRRCAPNPARNPDPGPLGHVVKPASRRSFNRLKLLARGMCGAPRADDSEGGGWDDAATQPQARVDEAGGGADGG